MDVQIFGHPKSKPTRAALRFFSERRVAVHEVDVRRQPPSPGELRRFVQRFGLEGVLDPESRAYVDQGLAYVSASDDDWLDRLSRDPGPLRLPLVRLDDELAVGDDPGAWRAIADAASS